MNHLAHALLGAADADVMFGSLIADFLRGATDPALLRGVRIGIALHRTVDRYTDAHPRVVAARRLFEPPLRRYAGITLDVWFDHLLARDWAQYADGSLHTFSQRVQDLIDRRGEELPSHMRGFARYLRDHDLPEAYRETSAVTASLEGLSRRLSRANPLATTLPIVQRHAIALDHTFAAFFPELVTHARHAYTQLARSSLA